MRPRVEKLVLRIIYAFSKYGVANSAANVPTALQDGLSDDKIKLIHNFVDVNSSKLNLNKGDEIQLLVVANFYDYKNHENLVKALGDINSKVDFRVSFFGEGPLRNEMISLAESLNLKSNFYDHEEQSFMKEFLADFLLLPSFFEGSSNALLEALAQGIPAIVTRVGLVPELEEMGAPLLVSNGFDMESLKDALMNGFRLKKELQAQAFEFKEKIEVEFGEAKVIQDWLDLIGTD
jgi:glycosyltransferase involved in cell wall biosynthesis